MLNVSISMRSEVSTFQNGLFMPQQRSSSELVHFSFFSKSKCLLTCKVQGLGRGRHVAVCSQLALALGVQYKSENSYNHY